MKKVLSKISQNALENTNVKDCFLLNIKKETPTHVLSFKFCEISKNVFFAEHLQSSASVLNNINND